MALLCLLPLLEGCSPRERVPAPAQPNAPAPLVWSGVSEGGAFKVQVAPRDGSAPIGAFHEWTIRIVDANDQPVYPARVGVSGGMPDHGHGMPTQPQVTDYLGDGRYLIEGMKFNMAGAWVLQFAIESEGARDRIELDIELEI